MKIAGYRPFVLGLGLLVLAPGAIAEDVAAVVDWSRKVELGTPVSGVIAEVHVNPGDIVSRGDKLISLDQRGFRAEVGRRLAAHRHAQALLEEARQEDERAAELYDRTVLSDFERNQALIALKGARATAEAARADLVAARLELEHSTVSAPFGGVMLAVNAAPGQTVVSELQSAPLVAMADNRVYRVRAQIDADRAASLTPGAALNVTVRGRQLSAKVAHVGLEPVGQSPQGPRYELVATLETDREQGLRVGETVILQLD